MICDYSPKVKHSLVLTLFFLLLQVIAGLGLRAAEAGEITVTPNPVKIGSGMYLQYTLQEGAYITVDAYRAGRNGETGEYLCTVLNDVYRFSGANFQSWNGKVNGELINDGFYKFTARDRAGRLLCESAAVQAARFPTLSGVASDRTVFNPIEEQLNISFNISCDALVTVKLLYNYTPVKNLLSGELLSEGSHVLTWDGKLDNGMWASDGEYVCQIEVVSPTVNSFSSNTYFRYKFRVEKDKPGISDLTIYPNPLRINRTRQAAIRFTLSEDAKVSVEVYRGSSLVRPVLNNQPRRAGFISAAWGGKDGSGNYVRAGKYTILVRATDNSGKSGDARLELEFYPCLGVMESIPANKSSTAPLDRNITLKFNDLVRKGKNYDQINLKVEDKEIQYVSQLLGDTLTIDPSEELAPGTNYTVTIPSDAIVDSSGKTIPDQYILNFTTETAPRQSGMLAKLDLSPSAITTFTMEGQRTVIDIAIDSTKAAKIIDKHEKINMASIPVTVWSDNVRVSMPGGVVKTLAAKGAVIEVQTKRGSIQIPSAAFKIDSLTYQLDTELKNIHINVLMNFSDPNHLESSKKLAGKVKVHLITGHVEFKVTATDGEKTIRIDNFDSHINFLITLPKQVNSNYAVGAYHHNNTDLLPMPTQFKVENGSGVAVIKSRFTGIFVPISSSKKFSDTANHWAQADINTLASKLIVSGVTKSNFAPQNKVTRAQFTVMVTRALGLKPGSWWSGFRDTQPGAWYAPCISTAVDAGLISGYSDQTFRPNAYVKREEAAAILTQAMQIAGLTYSGGSSAIDKFKDKHSISSWARGQVAGTAQNGIITGYPDGSFRPGYWITRAETAVMIKKLMQRANFV